jgi:hypothetical protein
MPSLDLYSGLQLDDEDGIESFLLAHRIRHSTYRKAASLQGLALTAYNLGAYPDDNWFQQHALEHLNLEQFAIPDQSVNLTILSTVDWDNQDDFTTWMQMHTLIHRRLDQAIGIFD